ncbi:alpha/beta hydrolase [Aetokthonos hydrillicola Thurmond2011]|jgi:hypothetical protein|uniref:Alpha/beta hydrolase n=1 Tax=Aetokthonos hydrillicola Thurmond2011 TaxID=2712845 RepID=A0AAP5I6E3_9CYAN|nr:alpha/beta hydrolase [Aetokthonos hydrillicola]MBO3457327.1 alpha/beta hydrolase [Aetokthonos hydrillicola CCALA 1050]MBW4586675.1 alpha/beta hydrolase [Aetokthonos hydrillicola CCALA 1050]MDR9893998.1 alpha/beta hydrolase [Aetokthonos hydrillicola Thurmond2011]
MQISQIFHPLKQHKLILFLGVAASVLLTSTSAHAANKVILKCGEVEKKVTISELNQFVSTGQASTGINAYLQACKQQPALARKALTAGIKTDSAFIDSLLSGWAGSVLVDQIGEVVHSDEKDLDNKTLRSALTGSVKESGQVTLIGALRNYPQDTVELEGNKLTAVYNRLSQLRKLYFF